MKIIKLILPLILLSLILTGCIGGEINIELNNDETGKIKYKAGIEKGFQEEIEELEVRDEGKIENPFEGIEAQEVTFIKGDFTYEGIESEVTFNSLEELTKRLDELFVKDGKRNVQEIGFVKTNDKVVVSQEADMETYEEVKASLNNMNLTIVFKLEGKVLENNADEFNENTNTLTWNLDTMFKEGIHFKYNTNTNTNMINDNDNELIEQQANNQIIEESLDEININPYYIMGTLTVIIISAGGFMFVLKRKENL